MAQPILKKRKAVTRDSPEADEVILSDSGGDLETALFNGVQSSGEEGEDDDDADSEIFESDSDLHNESSLEEDIVSDEIPSDADDDLADPKQNGAAIPDATQRNGDAEETAANYKLSEDANGNPRYIYTEIDPVYDTDDSDAPAGQNTIGNIPLSFYDSFPHIGYDINGKKISRPAKGEALDTLLDSMDLPKGWTGLTDPATGKPLQLSQQECVLYMPSSPLFDHEFQDLRLLVRVHLCTRKSTFGLVVFLE